MSIQADDEFSLRIALESELADVLPSEGLANLVIEAPPQDPPAPRRRGGSLVVVCAGIGVPRTFGTER